MPLISITSPRDLHYPVTITRLLVKPDNRVTASTYLFEFFYQTTVIEDDEFEGPHEVQKSFPNKFQCPDEGTLASWSISPGLVLERADVELAQIDVDCLHETILRDVCLECNKSLDEISYNTPRSALHRGNISISHTHPGIKVSQKEAKRLDQQARQRMVNARKLSLVVDLDLTIIHASVDPTIGEWQRDPSNPNYDAVKTVRMFELYDETLQRDVPYYIKLRPHLQQFLLTMSKIYELYIYTMGTRAYADNIAKIVDPDKKLFGDRILSRTETPGETSKNLEKLFPIDNRMVVIIDDRADVWKWSNYLVRVQPFNFFVGIGDINASFLPKQDVIMDKEKAVVNPPDPRKDQVEGATVDEPKPRQDPAQQTTSEESTASDDQSALQQIVTLQESNTDGSMQQKTAEQDENLALQINERPLLQLQQSLEDEHLPETQQNLLKDDDVELLRLQDILVNVHKRYYEGYDESYADLTDADDLSGIPDVKNVIDVLVPKPLKGARLVFSRLIPIDENVFNSRLADMARKLGAKIQLNVVEVTESTGTKRPKSKRRVASHVVARAGDSTDKMRNAARRGLPILREDWLWDQTYNWWSKIDESPYAIHVNPGRKSELDDDDLDMEAYGDSDDDEDEDEDDDGEEPMNGTTINGDLNGDQTTSPTGVNDQDWDDVFEAIPELDSDDEDEEDDSEVSGSQRSTVSERGQKRKREADEEEELPSGASTPATIGSGGSRLQMRKRKALARSTSLTNVQAAEPDAATEEDAGGQEADEDGDAAEDDDDDDPDGSKFRAAMAEALGASDSSSGEDDDGG